jgi:hypothetical protein
MPSDKKDRNLYKIIIGIFSVISLGSVVLVVILVRSRHTFSARPFHSGVCIYVGCFAPFALLKAVAVGKLIQASTQEEELTAGLLLNGAFMIFFWLGFGGKMALIQLWMHIISCHTSGQNVQSVIRNAHQTWKLVRLTVTAVCILYGIGFVFIVAAYARATNACVSGADYSASCVSPSLKDTPDPQCQQVINLVQGITYYEGIFTAVVAVVFTFYALMFNSLVYALLTSDPTFSNLSNFQRMLISNKLLRSMLKPCVCVQAP